MTDKNHLSNSLLLLLYGCFLASVVCGFRAVSSMAIGSILITAVFKNRMATGAWLHRDVKNRYVLACSLFFLLQLIPLAYSDHFIEAWKHVQVKSALLFLPLCYYSYPFINKTRFQLLMKVTVFTLALLLTWCLVLSCFKYSNQAGINVFFYHQLVADLGHHAVQFAILVYAALIYLLQTGYEGRYVVNRNIHLLLMGYFIAGILLLSSKLVILFMVGSLFYYLFITLKKSVDTWQVVSIIAVAGLFISSIILFTRNPISRRFNDIMQGNITLVQQSSFDPGDYFNGVQFRLLQWRFVKEILQENKAWIAGVSPAKAQSLLDQKYAATHMYTGVAGTNDRGFLGYNTHNQFLESLLQSGFIGLVCFSFICFEMVRLAVGKNRSMLHSLVLLLLAYSFTESVLETQYGLIIFIFLPLLFSFPEPIDTVY
ncbi:O-antigen ligase family protein [Longitalea luteola]|uniref:O-antigen ligase family protein n=1 Tax=Longitalea luteola TaxID=2812563 RepID=UPI001A96859B|nr:O-antigen ligase family protein [Longitalea luteola]